jgi:type II secretory pathway pseudopilin PulG
MWGQIASAVVGSLFSYKAAQEQRRQAINDQDNQFVRMRNAAQRAGFNPLTVLRNTGGQGFTGLPTISKAAAFGNAAAGIFDAFRQAPIDKYNKQVRDLTLKGMKADIAYTGILSKQALQKKTDELTYLYNADGTPRLNQFGQHMFVDPQAAAVFPTLQAYMTMSGDNLSLPHEQLLDMGISSLPTAVTAIEGGKKAAELPASPSMLQFPRQYKLDNGEWRRQTRAFSFGGQPFGFNPPVQP